MEKLDGKVAIVTDGATSIGKAICLLFAQEGAKVIVADTRGLEGEATATRLRNQGYGAAFVLLDTEKEEDWIAAIKTAIYMFGKIDILVNNKKVCFLRELKNMPAGELCNVLNERIKGMCSGMKYAIMSMKENAENCSIINQPSTEGNLSEEELLAYLELKRMIEYQTATVALECKEKELNIRVNYVDTDYIGDSTQMIFPDRITNSKKICKKNSPQRTETIAQTDVYLACEESMPMTGFKVYARK